MEMLEERQSEADLQSWREDKKLGWRRTMQPEARGKNEAPGDRKTRKKRKTREKLYQEIPATQSMPP